MLLLVRYAKQEVREIAKFEDLQKALTKGQSVVFYDNNKFVLGGGIINEIP